MGILEALFGPVKPSIKLPIWYKHNGDESIYRFGPSRLRIRSERSYSSISTVDPDPKFYDHTSYVDYGHGKQILNTVHWIDNYGNFQSHSMSGQDDWRFNKPNEIERISEGQAKQLECIFQKTQEEKLNEILTKEQEEKQKEKDRVNQGIKLLLEKNKEKYGC